MPKRQKSTDIEAVARGRTDERTLRLTADELGGSIGASAVAVARGSAKSAADDVVEDAGVVTKNVAVAG